VPATAAGADVRHAGEDGAAGAEVLPAGAVVAPHTVGAVAAAGRASATCARRPRVALLLTGDEVVPPGTPPAPGQVFDVHRYALTAQVRAAGGEVSGVVHAHDTAAAVRDALDALLAGDPHVVVSAGGISVGRHDHVWDALGARGFARVFRGVGIRPAHPTALARRGDGRVALALPGNPGAALVAFHLFGRPLLGCTGDWDETLPLAAPWPRREDAVQFERGSARDGRVTPVARRVTADGPAAWAPGAVLVRIPAGTGSCGEGDGVAVSRLV
jgi:molybdopterin molybdotransferase